jgi:hypothetical protein
MPIQVGVINKHRCGEFVVLLVAFFAQSTADMWRELVPGSILFITITSTERVALIHST